MISAKLNFIIASFLYLSSSIDVNVNGYSIQSGNNSNSNRRAFIQKIGTTSTAAAFAFSTVSVAPIQPANAAATILKTDSGIKYAITKPVDGKGTIPLKGDIVAIEYTGYLSNGQVRIIHLRTSCRQL